MEENEIKLSEEEIEDIINVKYSDKDDKTKDFIRKALKVHGNKYDYSKTVFTFAKDKVTIICPIHEEEFRQQAGSHVRGCGCPKCGMERSNNSRYLTKEEFIKRATKTHGDKYDYSEVNYVSAKTKVTIICKECGERFEQTPDSHVRGCGCPKCAIVNNAKAKRSNTEEFIRKAKELFPSNEYGYEKVEYVTRKTEVTIIDHLHNDEEFKIN